MLSVVLGAFLSKTKGAEMSFMLHLIITLSSIDKQKEYTIW